MKNALKKLIKPLLRNVIQTLELKETPEPKPDKKFSFPDSELAHRLLDHLFGIEIGGSEHNSFHLPHCLNVDSVVIEIQFLKTLKSSFAVQQ